MMKSHTFVAFAMLHRKVAVADRVQLVVADATIAFYKNDRVVEAQERTIIIMLCANCEG
jgi:hypothetical protein